MKNKRGKKFTAQLKNLKINKRGDVNPKTNKHPAKPCINHPRVI